MSVTIKWETSGEAQHSEYHDTRSARSYYVRDPNTPAGGIEWRYVGDVSFHVYRWPGDVNGVHTQEYFLITPSAGVGGMPSFPQFQIDPLGNYEQADREVEQFFEAFGAITLLYLERFRDMMEWSRAI